MRNVGTWGVFALCLLMACHGAAEQAAVGDSTPKTDAGSEDAGNEMDSSPSDGGSDDAGTDAGGGDEDSAADACTPGDEICDGSDNDCDGLVDADDSVDLLAHDPQLCEQQSGVCSGATKPASLCTGGSWQPCDAATYTAHDSEYGDEVCDGSDNDCNPDTPDGTSDASLWAPCDGTPTSDGCNDGIFFCGGGGALVCETPSLSFNVYSLQAGPIDALVDPWMFDSDGDPYVNSSSVASNYAYPSLQWEECDGGCGQWAGCSITGDEVCSSGFLASNDTGIAISAMSDLTFRVDALALDSYQHLDVCDGTLFDAAWTGGPPADPGDVRSYGPGIVEVFHVTGTCSTGRIGGYCRTDCDCWDHEGADIAGTCTDGAGTPVLRVTDFAITDIVWFPSGVGGPGGVDGTSVGVGWGTLPQSTCDSASGSQSGLPCWGDSYCIDGVNVGACQPLYYCNDGSISGTCTSDPPVDWTWLERFDNHTNHQIEIRFATFDPTVQECVGQFDAPGVTIRMRPPSGAMCAGTEDNDTDGVLDSLEPGGCP